MEALTRALVDVKVGCLFAGQLETCVPYPPHTSHHNPCAQRAHATQPSHPHTRTQPPLNWNHTCNKRQVAFAERDNECMQLTQRLKRSLAIEVTARDELEDLRRKLAVVSPDEVGQLVWLVGGWLGSARMPWPGRPQACMVGPFHFAQPQLLPWTTPGVHLA